MLKKALEHSFPRFIVVGISNTLISFGIFYVSHSMLRGFESGGAVAQFLSYLGGLIWSYFWNRSWSFKSKDRVSMEGLRFAAVQISLLCLSVLLIHIYVDRMGLPSTPVWICVMAVITPMNYALLRFWVFRKPRSG